MFPLIHFYEHIITITNTNKLDISIKQQDLIECIKGQAI
ncbi:hypothetical protein C3B55_00646 [Candidatus Pseudomonas adelgestsugas]|uniref:Uncharacterized protein n=1 Tax=Candidatus Pseudomonas adelgestsugas TaxID=1302376 RepID=A0ABX5R8J6_9PSED|nr:hypothetical protein C3B55_00646 [Candidatus Pseudomonas adelgestsugas]